MDVCVVSRYTSDPQPLIFAALIKFESFNFILMASNDQYKLVWRCCFEKKVCPGG